MKPEFEIEIFKALRDGDLKITTRKKTGCTVWLNYCLFRERVIKPDCSIFSLTNTFLLSDQISVLNYSACNVFSLT